MTQSATAPGRSAERREQLLEAADRAIQREGTGVSMAAIAVEAGITKPILYRHFGDKGGLYRALAERHTEHLLGSVRSALASNDSPRTRTLAAVDAYLALIEERPEVYRFLIDRAAAEEPSVAGQVAFFQRRLAEELAATIRTDLGMSEVERLRSEVWAHGLVGLVQSAGDWWLADRPMPRSELVEEIVGLLFGGLAAYEPVTPE
jgi:AcrR family transcriptional regulator